ncbi:MAG: bacterio-opsin activator domain-containing protein [Halodesulfurarchaeum sp.]
MSGLLTSLNTRLKLFEKVSLLLVVMILVASLNIGVIYVYHQQAEQLGNSVNIAGQERMLSQRMARLANKISRGENPDYARDQLRVARDRFEQNLESLMAGGTVPDQKLNPNAESRGVPQVILRGEKLIEAPPRLEPELGQLQTAWTEYRPHVKTVLTADPDTTKFRRSLRYVNQQSDVLLSLSDTITAEFAVVLRQRRAVLVRVLFVLLVIDLLVAGLGAFAARRYLGLPMVDIARVGRRLARGETESVSGVDLPLDTSLPDHKQRSELAQLSRSFEAVQAYHETASRQAQALARRKFDDPVFEERIPGELGRSLEEMRTDLPAYIDELRTTTEKLEALIQASPAGILIAGPKGQVKRWNPAAEDIFGWEAAAVEGSANPAIPDPERESFRELLSAAIVEGPISGVEAQWRTKSDNRVDVSLSLAAVPGGEETLEGVMIVIEDITERKERERTLRQQRDELESLNRITDLVLAITQELVESSNQDRIESTLCTSLTDSGLYDSAWIAAHRAGGPTLTVRTTADRQGAGESAVIEASDPLYDTLEAAFETGQLQISHSVSHTAIDGSESGETDHAVAAIPLTHGETVFGVLVVRTNREYAFSERERSGLRTLGKTVGFSIDAITDKKLLFADTVVELTFDVTDTEFPLVRTAAELGCHIWLDGVVAGPKRESIDAYLQVEGADPTEVLELAGSEPGIVDVSPIAVENPPHRVKVSFGEESVISEFAHRRARLQGIDIEDGSGTYTLEVPRNTDIETTVGFVQSEDDDADFVAKTESERQAVLGAETTDSIRELLTDRQFEVFKSAYFAGYFEWPRRSTIEDLAADLGVAGSTVNHHLRHAQLKIAGALFEAGRE